jgi:hypothetical protein
MAGRRTNEKSDPEGKQNVGNAGVISTNAGRFAVCVTHADEEWMIAKTVCRVPGLRIEKEHHCGKQKRCLKGALL